MKQVNFIIEFYNRYRCTTESLLYINTIRDEKSLYFDV